ncbi:MULTISPECIES: HlyD family secretion protein [Pseudomonas]|uniref:HlyD family secretion protein n=1 Tax=Pseudomonas quercus TaxID=2722792 RepID=A0ABX0YCQ1_9PSED|nr:MULTISPECIES: HlyD family secretion protein [Pseudomonas]MBF7142601.1 HlyD family secretion protein [Pseudomonas sp. LY10J]NJP01139.1 HlyD family secretion protein [Pseudomonas quercus]
MTHRTSISLAVLAVVACVAYAGWRLTATGSVERTDDAYIRADSVLIAPRLPGQVVEVAVEDNQKVQAGQLLARLDDSEYLAAQAAARANVAGAEAELKHLQAGIARQVAVINQAGATVRAADASLNYAQANARRYLNLSNSGAGTQQERQRSEADLLGAQAARDRDAAAQVAAARSLDVLKAQLEVAQATLDKARADLRQADLNLSWTRLVAPVDGLIGQRSARVGAYVPLGTPLMAVVPTDLYVIANFRETQLAHMRANQPVSLRVDSHPDQPLRGHLESLAPATGLSFSAIVPDNATGNFTKVVQRIPVKIRFDETPDALQRLRVGMSVVVDVDISEGDQ